MRQPTIPGAWRLTICQPEVGYRFSVDAFLLADFVSVPHPARCLDLGTGCGVVALCVARRFPQTPIIGLELQESLAIAARQNVLRNRLQQQIAILRADARQAPHLFPAASFGTVVCNPPYRMLGRGRLNAQPAKATARHELTLTLAQLIRACQHLLTRRGVLSLVYHPSRLAELCARLDEAHLRPRRLRLVHATLQTPASMVLVEAIQGSQGALTVLPPLCIYDSHRAYTAEMQAIFSGRHLPL